MELRRTFVYTAKAAGFSGYKTRRAVRACLVGRCRFTLLSPRTDPACFQSLNLKYDGPLSDFAFNCNLRHYSALAEWSLAPHSAWRLDRGALVGRAGSPRVDPRLTPG